jgi:hypothetical protein
MILNLIIKLYLSVRQTTEATRNNECMTEKGQTIILGQLRLLAVTLRLPERQQKYKRLANLAQAKFGRQTETQCRQSLSSCGNTISILMVPTSNHSDRVPLL